MDRSNRPLFDHMTASQQPGSALSADEGAEATECGIAVVQVRGLKAGVATGVAYDAAVGDSVKDASRAHLPKRTPARARRCPGGKPFPSATCRQAGLLGPLSAARPPLPRNPAGLVQGRSADGADLTLGTFLLLTLLKPYLMREAGPLAPLVRGSAAAAAGRVSTRPTRPHLPGRSTGRSCARRGSQDQLLSTTAHSGLAGSDERVDGVDQVLAKARRGGIAV